MANEEQLAILRQGVEVWNKWREENPKDKLDFSEADLEGVNLAKAKLLYADFRRANLHEAVLREAVLGETNLTESNLEGANLEEAFLIKANLNRAKLKAANLKRANLKGANLNGADLLGARLDNANLAEASLVKTNLFLAQLYNVTFHRANFEGSNLDKTTFADTWLQLANFSNTSLREVDFRRSNLTEVNLTGADITDAYCAESIFIGADLTRANLSRTNLHLANFSSANLTMANLTSSNLVGVNFFRANLSKANLTGTNLTRAMFIESDIDKAKISDSFVYAVNVWNLIGKFEEQRDLVITPPNTPAITVDNIKVAQFIYLLLRNEEIRDVINTLTSKTVLILGRFTPERKAVLDSVRIKLREYDLLPIMFDFDRSTDKDFTETIKTLAGISYFVIADVTNPKSSPLELQATVPDYQIPFVPIIQEGESPFAMMVDLQKKYNWVLNTVSYDSEETLIKALKPLIIDPAMKKRQELRIIKAQEPEIISAKDYLDKTL